MNRRTHDCEQEGCTKQTKARFCEEHLPRCTKCGTKCRKFEDPATAVCFNHSQYLRDKTREKVARYRARDRLIKQERKAAQIEISDAVRELVQEFYDLDHLRGDWNEFLAMLREAHPGLWLKVDMVQDACMVMDGLSGDELLDYKEAIILQLTAPPAPLELADGL